MRGKGSAAEQEREREREWNVNEFCVSRENEEIHRWKDFGGGSDDANGSANAQTIRGRAECARAI